MPDTCDTSFQHLEAFFVGRRSIVRRIPKDENSLLIAEFQFEKSFLAAARIHWS